MARRAFLLYSTVAVACPKDWDDEKAASVADLLPFHLAEHASLLEVALQEQVNPELKVKVID